MKRTSILGGIIVVVTAILAAPTTAQPPQSPAARTSVKIDGRTLTIKYSAPSVRGRQVFGEGGVVSKDKTYPYWRVGANAATVLHTDADLQVRDLVVPKGDYSLFALVNTTPWQLIINKQTGQQGDSYDWARDLGRIPMDMAAPPALVETFKITLSSTGPKSGEIRLEFENVVASVPFTVR